MRDQALVSKLLDVNVTVDNEDSNLANVDGVAHLLRSAEKELLTQRPLRYDNTLAYLLPDMLSYFDYEELL